MCLPRALSAAAVLVLSSGAVGAARAAEPMHVLIFSGGKTEADAVRALGSLKRLDAGLKQVLTLPNGYPRIVESRTLPGMKPGFWVVTLGQCLDPLPALSALKAVYPGAYSRPLTGEPGAEACPKPSAATVSAEKATLSARGRTLSAWTVSTVSADERGNDTSSSMVHFLLVEKATGTVLDLAETDGAYASQTGEGPSGLEYERCTATVRPDKGGLAVARDCKSERTGCNRNEEAIPKAWSELQIVSMNGDKLKVSAVKTEETASNPCNEGSDDGD